MSTRIRMARGGTKKRPFYRIIVANKRSARDGDFIEKLGTYDPLLPKDSPERVKFDEERMKYWLGVGALPTEAIERFLRKAGIIKTKPVYPEKKRLSKKLAKQQAEEAAAAPKAAPAA